MRNCLRTSWVAWNELDEDCFCTSEDVRALGISLFLECACKGVMPPVETVDEAPADYALAT
jgi:hypothetical protein